MLKFSLFLAATLVTSTSGSLPIAPHEASPSATLPLIVVHPCDTTTGVMDFDIVTGSQVVSYGMECSVKGLLDGLVRQIGPEGEQLILVMQPELVRSLKSQHAALMDKALRQEVQLLAIQRATRPDCPDTEQHLSSR